MQPLDPVAVQYGIRVRTAREAAGLTQEELGRQVKIARETVNKIENGRRPVGRGVASRLAGVLGGGVDDWVTYGRSSGSEVAEERQTLVRLAELEALVTALSKEVRALAQEVAESRRAQPRRRRGGSAG